MQVMCAPTALPEASHAQGKAGSKDAGHRVIEVRMVCLLLAGKHWLEIHMRSTRI